MSFQRASFPTLKVIHDASNGNRSRTTPKRSNTAPQPTTRKGTFSQTRQKIYLPTKGKLQHQSPSQQIEITNERIYLPENFQLSPNIYNFGLTLDEFRQHITKLTTTEKPRFRMIDKYFYQDQIYSITNKKQSHQYTEETIELDLKPQPDPNTSSLSFCPRKIKRSYIPQPTDLDSRFEYHLQVLIIRYQVLQNLFEIILPPSTKVTPAEIKSLWHDLINPNLSISEIKEKNPILINENAEYMVRSNIQL